MIEDVSNMSLSGFMIAEVKNNVDPDMEGKVAVYIPQLMYDNDYNEEPYEEEITVNLDSSLILNSSDFEDTNLELEESNYIWARPLSFYEANDPNWKFEESYYKSGSYRIPRIGSQVLVIFLSSDMQKCYYLPQSPTAEGDIVDSFNCIDETNFTDSEKRTNVDVIRFYWDGTRIEVDTNLHTIKLCTPENSYITLSNELCEIKAPQVHIDTSKLTVDGESWFNNTVDVVDLTTCHDNLEVQGTIYVYRGIRGIGRARFSDGLDVYGDTNLYGTLTAHSTSSFSGSASFNSTMNVSDSASFNSTVSISGMLTCSSQLSVQGAASFGSGISVTGVLANNGLNMSTHVHTGNLGEDTSSPH